MHYLGRLNKVSNQAHIGDIEAPYGCRVDKKIYRVRALLYGLTRAPQSFLKIQEEFV